MKKIYLLTGMIVSCISAFCQTDSLIKRDVDKMTGEVLISNSHPIIIKSANNTHGDALVTLLKMKDATMISFTSRSKDFGCTDETGKVFFLASDNSKLEVKNASSFNCGGASTLYLAGWAGGKKTKNFLKEKTIKAVRLQSRTFYIDYDVDDNTSANIKYIVTQLDK